MSCVEEEQRVEQARDNLDWTADECRRIAGPGSDPNDPDVLNCRARVAQATEQLNNASQALRECRAAAEATVLLQTDGLLTFLRVHDRYGWGGGASNKIDADVIFRLDTFPEKGFGFQLRDDVLLSRHEGMLALLRDAFIHGLRVRVDYDELIQAPNQNSFVIRVALVEPPPTRPDMSPVFNG